MRIKRLFIPILFTVLLTLSGCQSDTNSKIIAPTVTGNFEFTVLKAGQADAIFMYEYANPRTQKYFSTNTTFLFLYARICTTLFRSAAKAVTRWLVTVMTADGSTVRTHGEKRTIPIHGLNLKILRKFGGVYLWKT